MSNISDIVKFLKNSEIPEAMLEFFQETMISWLCVIGLICMFSGGLLALWVSLEFWKLIVTGIILCIPKSIKEM